MTECHSEFLLLVHATHFFYLNRTMLFLSWFLFIKFYTCIHYKTFSVGTERPFESFMPLCTVPVLGSLFYNIIPKGMLLCCSIHVSDLH